jgi:hypothetical protein
MMPFSDDLFDLAQKALSHAVDSVSDGGDLVPFVMRDRGDDKGLTLIRFWADRLEESVENAHRALREDPLIQRAALAYDGYINTDGARKEAVIVEAYKRGDAGGLRHAEPMKRVGLLRKRRAPDNDVPALTGDMPPLF